MNYVNVDCYFADDGNVQVRRVRLDGQWLPVEQGRQWQDDDGRHVLVMLPGRTAQDLLLEADSLRWQLRPLSGRQNV